MLEFGPIHVNTLQVLSPSLITGTVLQNFRVVLADRMQI